MTTAPLPRVATYALRHVWSTGTDADTSAYDDVAYETPPGVAINGVGRSQARAFGPPDTPILEDQLPNQDGIYAPGGELGSFVGRGPLTTFDVTWGSDVDVDADDVDVDARDQLVDGYGGRRLFTGNISTAPQQIDNPPSVHVQSLGTIRKLSLAKPIIPLYENILTGAAISIVADACGWDASARMISNGGTTLLRFWADGKADGVALLNAIVAAEGVPSCWYVDPAASGDVLIFQDRVYRQNAARSTEVQYTFFDGLGAAGAASVDDPAVFVDDLNIQVDGPLSTLLYHTVPAQWTGNPDEVVNVVTAVVNVRTATPTQTLGTERMKIWEYGGPVALTPSQVLDILIVTPDPFKSAVVPVAETDYHLSAGSLASVTLTQTSGAVTTLRLIAGGSGATVIGVTSNGPQLRAVSLPVTTAMPIVATVSDDLSSARFEPKPYTIPIWPEITPNQALDLANSFKRRYVRPRDQLVIRVVNLDADHIFAMLNLHLSDRVRIIHSRAHIDARFYVETLSHDLTSGGGLHVLVLGCERVTDDVPSRYGQARYGLNEYSE